MSDYDAGFREGLAEALRLLEVADVHRCDTWTILHREISTRVTPPEACSVDKGNQRDPWPVLVGLRATWEEDR